MDDKEKFLSALKANKGELEEYDLGAALGFTDERTKSILEDLLKEGKIEFVSFGLCSYRIPEHP
jgi:hypothetical protein